MADGEAGWAVDGSPSMNATSASAGGGTAPPDEIANRTSVITGRLKSIYRKTVLPVEKKYSYDYFYESPLMTDVEFDGTNEKLMRFLCSSFSPAELLTYWHAILLATQLNLKCSLLDSTLSERPVSFDIFWAVTFLDNESDRNRPPIALLVRHSCNLGSPFTFFRLLTRLLFLSFDQWTRRAYHSWQCLVGASGLALSRTGAIWCFLFESIRRKSNA
jgi:hypothetical protein